MRLDLDFALAPSQVLHQQVAAIPVRWVDGRAEILLITTRGKGRWMVPKGWPVTESPKAKCAAREAFEEAGVSGPVEPYSLGEFEYEKKGRAAKASFRACAYLLHVRTCHADWPERAERKRTWFPLRVAQTLVKNEELSELMEEAVRRSSEGPSPAALCKEAPARLQ